MLEVKKFLADDMQVERYSVVGRRVKREEPSPRRYIVSTRCTALGGMARTLLQ
jgi:hypothetical protein